MLKTKLLTAKRNMSEIEYNEETELDRYVLSYYPNLMTRLESLAQKAAFAEQKAVNSSSENMARKLREKWGHKDDPEVVAALSQGVEIFRRRVRERILRDHGDEVFLNKCSKCEKLVKTPRAKLCLWCGHSWHESS